MQSLTLFETLRQLLWHGRRSRRPSESKKVCAWITKFEGVDIWAASHCRTALVYAEWDVGPR